MAKLNEKEVREINAIIEKIDKALGELKKSKLEIGARDKATLQSLLRANKIETTKTLFFPCRREHSAAIVSHFITEKKIPQNKFSLNAQEYIFILAI
jgi:hypothetical protein